MLAWAFFLADRLFAYESGNKPQWRDLVRRLPDDNIEYFELFSRARGRADKRDG